MKKNLIKLTFLFLFILMFLYERMEAQTGSWKLAGNNLAGNEKLGSLNNFDLNIYTGNIQRMTVKGTGNGFVGIGTVIPTAQLHVNNVAGGDGFRVQIGGLTKLSVNSGGGVSIGSPSVAPANGLFVSGNAGIGTPSPDNKLHVFKSSAGVVAGHVNAPLVVENSTNCYLNLLAPNANETGILFGNPSSNVSGGIIYNNPNLKNGIQFRTFNNATKMVLTSGGNLGIGTGNAAAARLQILGGSDASLGGGGFIITGDLPGENIGIDANEIMARNNGAASTLFLNHNGGDVLIDDLSSGGQVGIGNAAGKYKLKVSHEGYGLNIEDHFTGNSWELVTSNYDLDLYVLFNDNLLGAFNSTTGEYYTDFSGTLISNIQTMHAILPKIKQLRPVTYQINNTDDQLYNGFIVQEVQKIFPSLVTHNISKERGLDAYLLNYGGFGVIAIKGIQELQQTLEEQHQKIIALEDRIAKLETALSASSNSMNRENLKGVSLKQNQPNPFNQSTIIHYTIPAGVNAQINVYDAAGNMVKTMRATESGQSKINANELKAGVYTYSLTVNGKWFASRKMVLTK